MIIITFHKNESTVKTVLIKKDYTRENLFNLTADITKGRLEPNLSFHKYEFHNSENEYEWSSNRILI